MARIQYQELVAKRGIYKYYLYCLTWLLVKNGRWPNVNCNEIFSGWSGRTTKLILLLIGEGVKNCPDCCQRKTTEEIAGLI